MKRAQEAAVVGGVAVALLGVACFDWRIAMILLGVISAGSGLHGVIKNAG